jgi:hypothetical protein
MMYNAWQDYTKKCDKKVDKGETRELTVKVLHYFHVFLYLKKRMMYCILHINSDSNFSVLTHPVTGQMISSVFF